MSHEPQYSGNSSTSTTGENVSCPISLLPPEVLFTILYLALPPSFLITPAGSYDEEDPRRRALSLKLSLILTCKTWYAVASRLLYEDVSITSDIEARCLLGALEANTILPSADLSKFIKSANFRQRDLTRHQSLPSYLLIKSFCPNLKNIGLELRKPRTDTIDFISGLSLTSLTIRVKARKKSRAAELLTTLAVAASTVIHLHLFLVAFDGEEIYGLSDDSGTDTGNSDPSDPRQLVFPSLQELEITFTPEHDPGGVSGLIELWSMHQLKRLTVHAQDSSVFRSARNLFRNHKEQIHYFHLDMPLSPNDLWLWNTVREYVEDFVSLSHLVLCNLPKEKGLENDNIEFIDVWQRIAKEPKLEELSIESKDALRLRGGTRTKQSARKTTGGRAPRRLISARSVAHKTARCWGFSEEPNVFPKLRQVRILDKTLRYLSHLPLDVPPDRVLFQEDEFSMDYDGIYIKHEVGKLIHVRKGVNEVTDSDEESEESF